MTGNTRYLRWALIEAARMPPATPATTTTTSTPSSGLAVARVEITGKLAEAVRHMLTNQVTFRPGGRPNPLHRERIPLELPTEPSFLLYLLRHGP
jgi:hypothetical protein